MLSHIKAPRRVLELGTFTGYATQCLAEGLAVDGKIVTLESDRNAAIVAESFIKRSLYCNKVFWCLILSNSYLKIDLRLGNAIEILPTLKDCFDLAFIDADKKNYIRYVDLLVERQLLTDGAILVIDNTLWKGLVLQQVWCL